MDAAHDTGISTTQLSGEVVACRGMNKRSPCPSCGGRNLFESKPVSAGGGHAPDQLPGLGTWWVAERYTVVLCQDCGLMRFFALETALGKLPQSTKWKRLQL